MAEPVARAGIDVFAARNRLTDMISKMVRAKEPNDIGIPRSMMKVTQWRWVFSTGEDKSIDSCSREELLEVVEALGQEVSKLQVRLAQSCQSQVG
jgi:hypothetical protein